jgi:hypothetical protein
VATAVRDDVLAAQRFLAALAVRDWAAIHDCLSPDIRLRALVPSTVREAEGPDEVVDRFKFWWDDLADFRILESSVEQMADRVQVRYRLTGIDPEDGPIVVEQQCYFIAPSGSIDAINSVCSGMRDAELLT